MRKWITNIVQGPTFDATTPAKVDIVRIAESVGYSPVNIFRYDSAYESDQAIQSRIDGISAGVSPGDIIVYQYPSLNGVRFEETFMRQMKLRHIKVVYLIHDIDVYRGTNVGYRPDEFKLFNQADALIVHFPVMADKLHQDGVTVPMISQYLLDYLDDNFRSRPELDEHPARSVIFAGNLIKSGYLADWHAETPITVYGYSESPMTQQLADNPHVDYRGPVDRVSLDLKLGASKAGFGLVWDSDLSNVGYGNYTRLSHPHKLSLYLAHDIPVIAWDKAAIAPFITQNQVGITLSSLNDLDHTLAELTDEDMTRMTANAAKVGMLIRDGYFTARALLLTEKQVLFGNMNLV